MPTKTIYINNLSEGQNIDDFFVLAQVRYSQSKNGPYWDLKLQDRTGEVEAKIWHPLSNKYNELIPEQIVRVQGDVKSFRDNLQIIIKNLDPVKEDSPEIDWSEFIPSSRFLPEDMLKELEGLCKETLTYPPWRRLCQKVLKDPEIRDKFLSAPAAKSIHHAYRGGLLEHTLNVVKACLSLCSLYPGLDRQILLVAAIFHDLGKAWEMGSGLTRNYTDQGRLLGHILLGVQVLQPFLDAEEELPPELILHLKHIILSHHGEYNFGSPKRPKTAEAFVLHFADNLDAKLNTVEQALDEQEANGSGWSKYQPSMERMLYRAAVTSDYQDDPRQGKKGTSRQCLLPLKE